jgi:hypothetical protein
MARVLLAGLLIWLAIIFAFIQGGLKHAAIALLLALAIAAWTMLGEQLGNGWL